MGQRPDSTWASFKAMPSDFDFDLSEAIPRKCSFDLVNNTARLDGIFPIGKSLLNAVLKFCEFVLFVVL